MIRLPPISTPTASLFPYTTLFRSPPPPLNHLEGPVDVAVVAREYGGHHWQLQVLRFRQLGDGAQLLRQAGAAEGEARPQVGRRNVEVAILAEDAHGVASIDAERLHQRAELVGERHLDRMKIGRASGRESVCQYV